MKKLVFLIIGCAISSCATYSKSQCEKFDWHNEGYDAAMNGQQSQPTLEKYNKTCGEKHNVVPNQKMFDEGYKKGISYLCTSSGGEMLGQKGFKYQDVCPKDKEAAFLKSYSSSRSQFLEKRVSELESEVSKLKSDLWSKDSEISDLKFKIMRCN